MKISKNNLLVWVVLVLLISSIGVVYAVGKYKPASWYYMKITLVNQDPDPVEPGQYFYARFRVENNGSERAEDVKVELLPEYPFFLDKGIDAVKNIGSVHGRQVGDIGVIVKYRIRVDKDAVEGENDLKLRYSIGGGAWTELDLFKIDVRTHDAILSISTISEKETIIKPGKTSELGIKIKNMADSLVKNIKVRLDLNHVPLATIGSTNEKVIENLDPNKETNLSFKLIAEPDADSNVYNIPIYIDYQDDIGTTYRRYNDTIGVIIGDVPDLSVIIDSTTIIKDKSVGKLTIKIVNKGVTDIKFLNVKLKQTNDFIIISPIEVYIGNVDSDDYETTDFDLYVKKNKEKGVTLPLVIEYKDANNNDYKKDIDLELKLYSTGEAKKFGLKKGSRAVGLFMTIAIIVGGIFGYRLWKKRKKKAKK